MNDSERWWTSINLIWATAICVAIFLVSSCMNKQEDRKLAMQQTVRMECIRQGGNWGLVSNPDDYNQYGCVKK